MKNKNQPPIVVAIPSTTDQKLRAIVTLTEAIYQLSLAINSTNVKVDISNCSFKNHRVAIRVDGGVA